MAQLIKVDKALIVYLVEKNNFDELLRYIKCGKNVLIFKVLVEKDRLDIIKRFAAHKIIINTINVTIAMKTDKYEIVKWSIDMKVYPNINMTYERANKINNFTIVEYLAERDAIRFDRRFLKTVYENKWTNFMIWLNSKGIFIKKEDKDSIDMKRFRREIYVDFCKIYYQRRQIDNIPYNMELVKRELDEFMKSDSYKNKFNAMSEQNKHVINQTIKYDITFEMREENNKRDYMRKNENSSLLLEQYRIQREENRKRDYTRENENFLLLEKYRIQREENRKRDYTKEHENSLLLEQHRIQRELIISEENNKRNQQRKHENYLLLLKQQKIQQEMIMQQNRRTTNYLLLLEQHKTQKEMIEQNYKKRLNDFSLSESKKIKTNLNEEDKYQNQQTIDEDLFVNSLLNL